MTPRCFVLAWLCFTIPIAAQAVKTAPVQRGDFIPTVAATGTVEPIGLVEVGPLVSGTVLHIGPGSDFRDHVEVGAALMQLDDSFFRVRLDEEKAHVLRLQAELQEAQQKHDIEKGSDVKIRIAEASLNEGEATLREAQMSLDATIIRSPVKGMILDRNGQIGQAVAPNPNGPSLFLIWPDGSKTQIWASVNENEVAMLIPGQVAQITCAGLPGKAFTGRVAKIHPAATRVREVVQYQVEIDVDNKDGVLIPYLTADARIQTTMRKNVLSVPNAALEWVPQSELLASMRRQAAGVAEPSAARHRVWMQDGKSARGVDVKIGPTDGQRTEIIMGDLKEGDQVVVEGALQ